MTFQTIRQLIAAPHKLASLKASNLIRGESKLIFYNTAIEAGIFAALAVPATADELAIKCSVKNRTLFDSILALGVLIGGLSYKKGKYAIRGALSKAAAAGHPSAEWIREMVHYHGRVAIDAATIITGEKPGNYLHEFGGLIAKSSRLGEFAIKAFIMRTIEKTRTFKILEIGCGSGEYLKYYAAVNPGNTGIGIDKDPRAAAIAGESLVRNGIDRSFKIIQENILQPVSLKNESFDIVTSFSNVYYFSDADRAAFFKRTRELLATGGRFMLATMYNENRLISRYFDVIFTATRGLYQLPRIKALVNELKDAGYADIRTVNIYGGICLGGIVAYK